MRDYGDGALVESGHRLEELDDGGAVVDVKVGVGAEAVR